jgi:dCMP deaminase
MTKVVPPFQAKPMTQGEWDNALFDLCVIQASKSPDPSTKVGAVVVTANREMFLTGTNRFAPGIAHTPERLADRDTKLKLIVHAEHEAILSAVNHGVSLRGATLYFIAVDRNGRVWGGAPCARCANAIISVGIKEVRSLPRKNIPSRWQADCDFAQEALAEAGVVLAEAGKNWTPKIDI